MMLAGVAWVDRLARTGRLVKNTSSRMVLASQTSLPVDLVESSERHWSESSRRSVDRQIHPEPAVDHNRPLYGDQ